MTTLFVVQFLALLWNAGLTLAVSGAFGHSRDTRHAVTAAFQGRPNDLHLSAQPLPTAAVSAVSAMTRTGGSRPSTTPPAVDTPRHSPAAGDPVASGAVRGPDDLVAPPPRTVRGDTVRDWLVHYAQSQNTSWTDVVTEFYQRAATCPHIAAYFEGVDLDQLQRHFTATMVMVTNSGLTAVRCSV